MHAPPQKRPRLPEFSPQKMETNACRAMKVAFAQGAQFVKIHYFDPSNGHAALEGSSGDRAETKVESEGYQHGSQLTEELTLLSTLHGRARRELRDISKNDLKTVLKYGVKTPGRVVNGEKRWKFEFGNTIYITDEKCSKEVTCYKKAVKIEHAKITQEMLDRHDEAVRVLKDDPQLCTTHSIIVIDQSGSMRACDVNCFRSRSDAAYGTLALDYIAEQLYQQRDGFFIDAVTIVEMNDTGSILIQKEPLDWILFNRILDCMETAKPKSHGNYLESLEVAEGIIERELALFDGLDLDDIQGFMLVFISDGKPSDSLPEHKTRRRQIMIRLAQKLKSKLTFLGMGIGSSGSDFEQMELLVNVVKVHGGEGTFVHAGLNPASISTSLSSMATSMTTTRNDILSKKDEKKTKKEKVYTMKMTNGENRGIVQVRRESNNVSRWLFDTSLLSYPWRNVPFMNHDATAFEVECDPFGKGGERLAYLFYEIKSSSGALGAWTRVGKKMVAKESRYIEDEESKEAFHTSFCRVQRKASDLAKMFNESVRRAPLLMPADDEVSIPPPIVFLKCSIYEYKNVHNVRCGLLVEKYLNGKFTKYNGNNGYVNNVHAHDAATIDLAIGEVRLTDFIQAFSHWVYEKSGHEMIVCDLQGILDLEGKSPVFRLTDPAICSKVMRYQHGSSRKENGYGKTDLGLRGIRQFCRNHKCNCVCKGLNLPPMRSAAGGRA